MVKAKIEYKDGVVEVKVFRSIVEYSAYVSRYSGRIKSCNFGSIGVSQLRQGKYGWEGGDRGAEKVD